MAFQDMTTELQTERHDHTLVMTLYGPATRNALSPQVYAAGIETLNMAESNPDVRAVILTGHGSHFCGGTDVQRLAQHRAQDLASGSANLSAFHQWVEALRSFPKPVIAAVEGLAAGSGLSLTLACDLVVAAENARFATGFSEMALTPDGGASWHLAHAVGRAKAMALLWLGEPQTAQQWQALGLVQQMVPAGSALTAALAWAEQLGQRSGAAIGAIKELVNEASGRSLNAHLQAEQTQFMRQLVRPEVGPALDSALQGDRR